MRCEHCRQQLLPFLYDLLEPLEREATAVHLESCPECREALKASREQLGLLMSEAIPRRIERGLCEPERARQVDHSNPLAEDLRDQFGRDFVRSTKRLLPSRALRGGKGAPRHAEHRRSHGAAASNRGGGD